MCLTMLPLSKTTKAVFQQTLSPIDILLSSLSSFIVKCVCTGNPNDASFIWYRGFALKDRSCMVNVDSVVLLISTFIFLLAAALVL